LQKGASSFISQIPTKTYRTIVVLRVENQKLWSEKESQRWKR